MDRKSTGHGYRGGGGGRNGSLGSSASPTHPATSENREKNEIHQRGPKLEVNFRHTNFFVGL